MWGADDSISDWVGYYQPGNKKDPIRYTEAVDDEEEETSKKPGPKKKEEPPKKKEEQPQAAVEASKEGDEIVRKILDGEEYFWRKKTNALWRKEEDGSLGPWVGYYQPKNFEDPIRYTDEPEGDDKV